MDPLDAEIQAARAELAALRSESSVARQPTPTVPTETPWYSPKQLGYDIATGALKAGWGLADLITTPGVALARAGGLDVPYFGISKMGAADLAALAPQVGIEEGTIPQQIVEFATPIPGKGKLDMAKQAGLGLASYLGMKGAEKVAPETPYAGLVGSLVAPLAALTTGAAAKALAPKLDEIGSSLQRGALGIRKSDYTKTGKNQIIETLSGDYETQLKRAADEVIDTNQLGRSTDPTVLYSNLQDAKASAEDQIQAVLAKVDAERQTGIIPRLDETLNWIKTKAPADKVDFYKQKVNDFLKALKENGQGSLTYLNQQKKAIGENWRSSPETDPTFWRTFYKDVKQNIEKHAPEVKDLNKTKQDLLILEPVIERSKRAAEQGMTAQDLLRNLLYTTGGLGLPGAAFLTGNPVAGALLAGALGLAGTRKGNQLTGRTLSTLSDAFSLAGPPSANGLAGLLSKQIQVQPQASPPAATAGEKPAIDIDAEIQAARRELEALRGSPMKQDVSFLINDAAERYGVSPKLVNAVVKTESAGKSDAVSPKGAQGLMQLMPKTAKALGVEDPMDPAQNIEGGVKYLAQLIKKFGDEKLALAAYNWGEGNIRKQLDRLAKRDKPQTLAAILKFGTLPTETENYIRKISRLTEEA